MRISPVRRAALAVGTWLEPLLPERLRHWARAMRHEIDQIDDDRRALGFALGCLWAAALGRFALSAGEDGMTRRWKDILLEPRAAGVASAIAATLLGVAYLVAAGAPVRYPVVNLAALAMGLVALGGADKAGLNGPRASGPAVALAGSALLATALFGASVEGASRWIWIGPLSVQVSLVLIPFMAVSFARHRDRPGLAGIALAALALALQPDRAMAGALALGLAALATTRRDGLSIAALLAALAGFAVTLVRPDNLPAVPFVDRVFFTAFAVHPLAGAAILLGAALLILPPVLVRAKDPAEAGAARVFAALWIGCIAAAALGDYPTPVVGYGGSAILGYALSLAAFPPRIRSGRPSIAEGSAVGDGAPSEPPRRRSGLAIGH